MKIMRRQRAIALALVLALVLPLTVGFTSEPNPGCGESIREYAPDVIDFSRQIAPILRAKHPDRAVAIDEYVGYAETFYEGWQRNELDGMATLPALLNSFQTTIRPLLDPNNTALQIAAAGLDFALRKFSRYWQKNKERIEAAPAELVVAKTTAKAKGVDLESADKTVADFLRAPKIEKPKK